MGNPIQGLPSGNGDFGVTANLSPESKGQAAGEFMKTLQDAMSKLGICRARRMQRSGNSSTEMRRMCTPP